MAPTLDDMQVRSAIAEFVRLSERPPLAQAQRLIHSEPDVMARPWAWLAAVMRRARDSGDHHLAAAGLQWACYWTAILAPRLDPGTLMELELDPIPVRAERRSWNWVWHQRGACLKISSSSGMRPDRSTLAYS
jgi:hypothetical protein